MCFNSLGEGTSASEATIFPNTRTRAKNLSDKEHIYSSPTSSSKTFWTMKVATWHNRLKPNQSGEVWMPKIKILIAEAILIRVFIRSNDFRPMQNGGNNHLRVEKLTVFDNSLPFSIVRRHNGTISVLRRNLITSVSSTYQNQMNNVATPISQKAQWLCDGLTVFTQRSSHVKMVCFSNWRTVYTRTMWFLQLNSVPALWAWT